MPRPLALVGSGNCPADENLPGYQHDGGSFTSQLIALDPSFQDLQTIVK